jgi:hypothetical protein
MNASRATPLLTALLLATALLASASVRAQVNVSDDLVVRLTADASVGYVSSTAQGGLNSVNFGLSGDLTGYYYHPSFLQFQFSPYYNQGREYSVADFIAGNKGFHSSMNLFSGGNIPLNITYSKALTDSGLYGLAGSQGSVVGEGANDYFSVNWSVRLPRYPSFQVGYHRNHGDYRIFGPLGSFGRSNSNGYFAGAQYQLLGFALAGSFDTQRLRQDLPQALLPSLQGSRSDTKQRNLQFSANRSLGESTSFDLSARRSHWDTDLTSTPQHRRYDTVSAGLSSRPAAQLSTSFRINYVSNLNALFLGSVLPGAGSNPVPLTGTANFESRTRYLTYHGAATYEITRELNFRAGLRQGFGRLDSGQRSDETNWNSTLTYRRDLWGGRFTTGYTTGLNRYKNGASHSSSQAHSGVLNFSRLMHGWQHSGIFQYSNSDIDSLQPGSLRTLSTEFNSSGRIRSWRLIAAFRYDHGDTVFNVQTRINRQTYRATLTRGNLNFGASFQVGSGLSIFSLAGQHAPATAPVVGGGSEFERLLIPNHSSSLSLTTTYQFGRRSSLFAGWTRMNTETTQAGVTGESHLDQFNFHVRHWFRQLDCRAGFRRYSQSFSLANGAYSANTVYFQVSRHFDVF